MHSWIFPEREDDAELRQDSERAPSTILEKTQRPEPSAPPPELDLDEESLLLQEAKEQHL